MLRLLVLLVTVFVAGCASKSASVNTFSEPTYTSGSVKSVAILPMTNSAFAPGANQQIMQSIGPRLAAKNPDMMIISPADAVAKVNEAGLANLWAGFLQTYMSSGIADAGALRTVGEAVGSDAILQGAILNVAQFDGIYGYRAGETVVTVQLSLFDTAGGGLIWQGSSEGRSRTATTVESAPPVAEAVQLAIDALLENMPRLN